MTTSDRSLDPVRHHLLGTLVARISAYRRSGDTRSVMDDDVLDEVRMLIDRIDDSPSDLDAQGVVGELFWARYEAAGVERDRRRSVAHYEHLFDRTPRDIRPEVRARITELETMLDAAGELIDRAALPGGRSALDRAIAILHQVIELRDEHDRQRAVAYTGLASAYEHRFQLDGGRRREDLEDAFSAIDDAIALSHAHDPERLSRVAYRNRYLATRFDETGQIDYLAEAIKVGHEVLRAARPDHRDLYLFSADLTLFYKRRYDYTMAIADLHVAIAQGRAALASPTDDHQWRVGFTDDLGVVLVRYGEHTGDTTALREAVDMHRRAADEFPTQHIDSLTIRNNLGRALLALGRTTIDAAVLNESVAILRAAVEDAGPRGHRWLPGFRHNLAVALGAYSRVTGDTSAIEEQVELLHSAATGLPDGSSAARDALSDLGAALCRQAETADDPALVDDAIKAHRQAVAGFTPGDPAVASRNVLFADALVQRYAHTSRGELRAEALNILQSIAQLDAAPASVRVRAAGMWGRLEADSENWAAALTGLSLAVELLPRAAARNLRRDDQERQLMREPRLVADAVAVALLADDVEHAAVLFEAGRGVLTAHALADLGRLTRTDKSLGAEFERLRDALDGADGSRYRGRWADEWDALLDRIHLLDDFRDFLAPMTAAQLRAAASDGPIIMVNVSDYGSAAIVIRTSDIEPVPLPLLTPKSLEAAWLGFVVGIEMSVDPDLPIERVNKARQRIEECLEWLWTSIVHPVLERLGIDQPPSGRGALGRTWWLPSNLLNFLPLHAAARQDEFGRAVSALDCTISSYAPTVRSLVRARRPRHAERDAASGPLVVAMPKTLGQRDLPSARKEAHFIDTMFPGTVTLIGHNATKDAVLATLPNHRWAHLSCHGRSDRTDPSASHLMVAEAQKLTVLDVSKAVVDGELAYLSACSTGRPGLALVDEALHLAGAFQLAGYRHVLASMWPIRDDIALRLARRVYSEVRPLGDSIKGTSAVLHSAVREVRTEYPDSPLLWASFVHFGP